MTCDTGFQNSIVAEWCIGRPDELKGVEELRDVNFRVEVEQVEALEEWDVVDATLACSPLEN